MQKVRRAKIEDARGIHEAHMRSVQEICAKDHSNEEIQAWGHRPFNENNRVHAIKNQFVWVVENNSLIEGYGHFGLEKKEDTLVAHIYGLYLAPEAIGNGFGAEIANAMIKEAKFAGAKKIILESTLTAHQFYKHLGFTDSAPQTKISIGGVEIRCFPMSMTLTE